VSEDTRTKSRGGNAGLFARGKRTDVYGDVFEQKAFSLPLDAVSDVFQSKDGYYIIKVMEKKSQEQETFEDVKQRIERTLKTEKQKTAMESYLEGLKKRYTVKMLDESLK
jgi:parvulin-like peptidyl-prolyl isomerase